jgi:uroporphyrinogen-III decarboxylase
MTMTSKDRVLTTMNHEEPDRVPLYTFGLDPKFIEAFGGGDSGKAFDFLQLDCFPIRLQQWCQSIPVMALLTMDIPETDQTAGGTYAGWNGVDEFGRIWKRGSYVGGALRTRDDIDGSIPPLRLDERMPNDVIRRYKESYPDKAFVLNAHLGPFGLTMESMGYEHFCYSLYDDLDLVKEILHRRTGWFIELCRHAEKMGVDFIVMGDDVAYKGKTFLSPKDFRELALPCYRRIVESLAIPVLWHSDGFIEPVIHVAVEAGIAGLQCIEPLAGNDLGRIKREFGDKLVLLGNVSTEVLVKEDLERVRREVDRCMAQGKGGGGYMIASDCSLHAACTPEAVTEMYRYALEVGRY